MSTCPATTQFANIRLRRATNAEFSAVNTVLSSGEPAYAVDTRVLKIGDGVTPWNSLLPVSVNGSIQLPIVLGSENINVSEVGNTYIVSTIGVAESVHTHVCSDITDLSILYSPSGHTHICNDITDLASLYSPSGHQHTTSDITDLQTVLDGYAISGHQHIISDITDFEPQIYDLGPFTDSDTITIDYGTDKRIQTLNIDGTPVEIVQGLNWFTSSTTSREVLLQINVTTESTITWTIIGSEWYNQPPNPLPTGDHIVLLRDMGTYIQGHYIGSKTGSL